MVTVSMCVYNCNGDSKRVCVYVSVMVTIIL